ncbi:MAG TPA: ribosome biogenesis GTPase Der [Alphaproteobacteria bacterium]|nr:ribosome biogenesis GTPase Der [Alphaproteobacteria bacterium]
MAFTIAIVGRPNVGKSTLFNRLVARRAALVDDAPGLTRDRREGEGQLGDLRLRVVDTAGLEDAAAKTLGGRMRAQTERAVRDADAVLFMIDARAGVTALDRHFASWLRRLGRPIMLLANKAESMAAAASGVAEAHGLGLGAPIAVSAEHGEGLAELHAALKRLAPADAIMPAKREAGQEGDGATVAVRPIRLAVVGRPNVGKSTLVNRLLGEERVLTGPEPGITRDAIEVPWRWRGRSFVLVDTAGLRRKARIDDPLERKSTQDALRAIRAAQVVILVLDAAQLLEKQDLAIARLAAEEGRALVLAVNKWDLIDAPQKALRQLRERIEISLPQIKGVRFATVSALHGRKLDELMRAVVDTHQAWNREVPTPKLNRWLEAMNEAHPPPIVGGRRPRLRFMRQASARPPTFAIFGNKLTTLPDDYLRYLANGLRKSFGLDGCVIRFQLRQAENPYDRR